MRKKFGIDIDGTVTCPSALVPFLNDAFNLNITLADIKQYDLLHLVDVPAEEFSRWFKQKEPEMYEKSPLATGAKRVIDHWKDHHDLLFISARPAHLLQLTREWFTKQEIAYHHIELIGSHYKIDAAKKHKVDIFFEDKHDNAVEIHEECGIPVILFDTPYNQDPIPSGVIRVKTWEEANIWVTQWLNKIK